MGYKINVARETGRALPRWTNWFYVNMPTQGELASREVFEEIKKRFPECKVTVSRWEHVGRDLDW